MGRKFLRRIPVHILGGAVYHSTRRRRKREEEMDLGLHGGMEAWRHVSHWVGNWAWANLGADESWNMLSHPCFWALENASQNERELYVGSLELSA